MQRAGLRGTFDGVVKDVPMGVFSSVLPVLTYNPTTGVIEGGPAGGGGGPPTGAAGGQLSGTYPNPSVAGITTTTGPTALTVGAIASGEMLVRSGANVVGQTVPTSLPPNGAAGGDLGGSYPNPTVTVARGLRETAGPTNLVNGAIAINTVLHRDGAGNLVGGPATMDASGNMASLGTLNTRTIANFVDGPGSVSDSNVAVFNGTTGKALKDIGLPGGQLALGPGAAVVSNRLAAWNGVSGQLLKDSGILLGDVVTAAATIAAGNIVTGVGGKAAQDSGIAASLINAHASRHNPAGADAMFAGSWAAGDVAQWSGTVWVPKRHVVLEVTSNFPVPAATLGDITGLTTSLLPGTYYYDFTLHLSQATAVSTNGVGVNLTTAPTRVATGAIVPNAAATTAAFRQTTAINTALTGPGTQAVGVVVPVMLSGTIVVATTGTFSVRAQRSAAALTILAGSGGSIIQL